MDRAQWDSWESEVLDAFEGQFDASRMGDPARKIYDMFCSHRRLSLDDIARNPDCYAGKSKDLHTIKQSICQTIGRLRDRMVDFNVDGNVAKYTVDIVPAPYAKRGLHELVVSQRIDRWDAVVVSREELAGIRSTVQHIGMHAIPERQSRRRLLRLDAAYAALGATKELARILRAIIDRGSAE